jgi:drug/metabolite transporter, DME family
MQNTSIEIHACTGHSGCVTRTSSRSAGFALITIGTLLWGTGGVAGSLVAGNSALPLLSVSAVRLLAGGTLLLAAAAATGRTRRIPRTPASARRIAATAVLTAVMTASYFQSLGLAGVAIATALSLGIAPLSVAGYTAIRTRHMPAPRILAALAAGTAGLALVCGAPQARTSPAALTWGVVLAAVSGVAFAAITIMNRRVVPGLTPAPLLGISFVLAGLISLAWSVPAGIDLGSLNRTAWGALGVLTLFQTTVGYLAFYAGLQRGVSSTTAAVLSLLEPVAATVLAIVLLGQHLAILAGAGIVILLAAVLLVREPDAAARNTTADSTPDTCMPAAGTAAKGRPHQSRGGNHPPGREQCHRRARLRRDCTHLHGPARIRRKRPVLTKR